MFLICGSIIFKFLKYSEIGLAYSKIPTYMKAYTYAGKAIERLDGCRSSIFRPTEGRFGQIERFGHFEWKFELLDQKLKTSPLELPKIVHT